ncbi:MAG: hypothetical protein IGS38_23265 [Synechococcales cyanobacterium M58_A2018_015]|nr:hypothetical protein [Synechococcales cyanobacterium M58_A2018_015]
MAFHPVSISASLSLIALAILAPPIPLAARSVNLPDMQIAQAQEPEGRINPSRPIRIEVVNAGDAPITCVLTQPASAERTLAPGSRTSFGSTRTSYLPLPVNLLVYPQTTDVGLSSYIFVEGNVVTVVVGAQLSATAGDISMTIEPNGNIYLF